MSAPSPGGALILTYRGAVYPRHLDHMGHMNVQFYVAKFDEAVWHLFDRIGVTPGYIRAHDRGMAAVEMNVRYLKELRAGDLDREARRAVPFPEEIAARARELLVDYSEA